MQLHAFLRRSSAQYGEPLDPGEVRGNCLSGAVAVQRGSIHGQTATERRVTAVCALLETRQQQRELRYVIVRGIHLVLAHIHSSAWVPTPPIRDGVPGAPPYLHVKMAGMVPRLRSLIVHATGRTPVRWTSLPPSTAWRDVRALPLRDPAPGLVAVYPVRPAPKSPEAAGRRVQHPGWLSDR